VTQFWIYVEGMTIFADGMVVEYDSKGEVRKTSRFFA
jgi:hypothetical protein